MCACGVREASKSIFARWTTKSSASGAHGPRASASLIICVSGSSAAVGYHVRIELYEGKWWNCVG